MAIGGFETDSFAEGFVRGQPAPIVSTHEFDESRAHARNQNNLLLAQSFHYGFGAFIGINNTGVDSLAASSWLWPVPYGTNIGYGFRTQFDPTTPEIAFESGVPIRGTVFNSAFDLRLGTGFGMLFTYRISPTDPFEAVYGDVNGLPAPSPLPPLLPGIWRLDISEQLICLSSRLLGAAMPVVILTSIKDLSKQLIFNIGDIPAGTGFLQSPPPGTNLITSGTAPASFAGDPNLAHIIIDTRVFFGNQTPCYPRAVWVSPGSLPGTDAFNAAYGFKLSQWGFQFDGTRIG